MLKRGYIVVLGMMLFSCFGENDDLCSNIITIEEHFRNQKITGFQTTDSGLAYKIEEGTGDQVPADRVINCVLDGLTLDGKVFAQSTAEQPFPIKIGDGVVLPGIEEALTLMKMDEEGVFYLPASIAFGDDGSADICPGEAIRIDMKGLSIKKNIEEYLAENEITDAIMTNSGLYYREITPGEGDPPSNGAEITMAYKGSLLNGTQFDESEEFTFTLGQDQLIEGFTEGIKLFNKGSEGILYIPYQLAYGSSGIGTIGGYEALIFEISITDIK